MDFNNKLKAPPLTNILQMLQIVVIAALALSWWSNRESKSSVTDTTQSLTLEEHGRRLDADEAHCMKLQEAVTKNIDDLHELMTKFRIMVELVDGNKTKPELHK